MSTIRGTITHAGRVASRLHGDDVATQLYCEWYAAPVAAVHRAPGAPPLPRLLRAAHAGADHWTEDTPVILAGAHGVAAVLNQGRPWAVCRGDYVTAQGRPGCAPRPDDRLRVRKRTGGLADDGWWRTWGGGWTAADAPEGPLSRIYLDPDTSRLADLVRAVTGAMLGRDHPWAFKVAASEEQLGRADAAVVYVPDAALRPVLGDLTRATIGLLRTQVPPLTCQVAPGISWAQDDGGGTSFGESRCAIIAMAAASWHGGTDEAWFDHVADAFAGAGLSMADPHLRSGR